MGSCHDPSTVNRHGADVWQELLTVCCRPRRLTRDKTLRQQVEHMEEVDGGDGGDEGGGNIGDGGDEGDAGDVGDGVDGGDG